MIADEIRERIKKTLDVTVSVGVSFNKVFAKLGSDMKKPDATTVISRENFRELVWSLPVSELLFVGRATSARLHNLRIDSIGELALADEGMLRACLGKNGLTLQCYAQGRDSSPVLRNDESYPVKSVGNSTTTPRDLLTQREAEIVLAVLCESVGVRLRAEGKRCTVVRISVRGADLSWRTRQCRIEPTASERDIYSAARLLYASESDGMPVRSLGVCGAELIGGRDEQLSIFDTAFEGRARLEALDRAADAIRERHGKYAIRRGLMLEDPELSGFCPYEEHTVHPIGRIS